MFDDVLVRTIDRATGLFSTTELRLFLIQLFAIYYRQFFFCIFCLPSLLILAKKMSKSGSFILYPCKVIENCPNNFLTQSVWIRKEYASSHGFLFIACPITFETTSASTWHDSALSFTKYFCKLAWAIFARLWTREVVSHPLSKWLKHCTSIQIIMII